MAKSKSSKTSKGRKEQKNADKQIKVDPKIARREAEKQRRIVERTPKASLPGNAHNTGKRRMPPLGKVAVKL